MALAATTVWEVQTGGDDNNGGGYKSDAGTTDYSQQASAQLTVTDGATSGVGVTTLTSATGGFTSAMVGNIVHLYSGTNLTADWYEITAYTDTNTVTLDRAPDDGVGGVSGATCKVGGALASPGILSDLLTVDLMRAWIKSGTYTITTATVGSGGPFQGPASTAFRIEGYTTTRGDRSTKPIISAGTVGSISIIDITNASFNDNYQIVVNLKIDGNSQTSVNGIKGNAQYSTAKAIECDVVNCTNGFYSSVTNKGLMAYRCTTDGCTTGFEASTVAYYCEAVGGTSGFHKKGSTHVVWDHCIARDCSGDGFSTAGYNVDAVGCVAENCGGDGFDWGTTYSMGLSCIDCVAINNSGYGFNVHESYSDNGLINCSGYNNTLGNVSGGADTELNTFNFQDLSGDPFVDTTAHDYSPDNTAGEGADLRNQTGVPGQVVQNDLGAVQHADPAGGGGTTVSQGLHGIESGITA